MFLLRFEGTLFLGIVASGPAKLGSNKWYAQLILCGIGTSNIPFFLAMHFSSGPYSPILVMLRAWFSERSVWLAFPILLLDMVDMEWLRVSGQDPLHQGYV